MVRQRGRHCERSEAIQEDRVERFSPVSLGCFVALLLASGLRACLETPAALILRSRDSGVSKDVPVGFRTS